MEGTIITAETFDAVIQFSTAQGGSNQKVLHDMTCLHAPSIALTSFSGRSTKNDYTNNIHCYLASITGGFLSGAERETVKTIK